MSSLSNLDGFRDRSLVAIQLLLWGLLLPGLILYSLQHSFAIAVKLSLHTLSQRPCDFRDMFTVTLGDFSSRFLKCCFHRCVRSSWLTAFSLSLVVLFLLLTSFSIYHTILDCLSLTESVILLIRSWMDSVCSSRYVLFSSFCAFLSFWALALFRFLILHTDAVFTPSHFFLTANVSHFILSLVGMHSAAASM